MFELGKNYIRRVIEQVYVEGIFGNQAFPEMPRQLRKFVILKIYLRTNASI
jgi:hypothetical protein